MPRCATCHRRLLDGVRCPADGEEVRAERGNETVYPAPPEVPGYTLHHRLGAGGFAQVFSAARDNDGEPVALKIALLAGDWRFAREAEALRRVPTPHAPKLIECGDVSGHPFIAMELVAGRSMADWLGAQSEATPPRSEALNVLRSICHAVDAIHETGLIHRDLKPENLILSGEGVTAIDFGLAREAGSAPDSEELAAADLTATGERLGTAAYMAPEQCLGHTELGFGVDVYAVAVMAYELLCGRPPFVGSAAEIQQGHVAGRPPPPSSVVEVSATVDAVLARGLSKVADDRHKSAGELFFELAKALQQASTAAKERPARSARSRSRRRLVALLAIDSGVAVERIQEAATLEDGELVRTRGTSYVVAFPRAVSLEGGIRAAVSVAGRLEDNARRCVAHAAPLRIKESSRGIMALGRALDDVESWTPPRGKGGGLLLTADAAAELSDSCRASGLDGFYVWASISGAPVAELAAEIPLRGRAQLFERLQADRQRSAGESIPIVSTVIGDSGAGKSRILDELAVDLDDERGLHLRVSAAPVTEQLLCFALENIDLADREAVGEAAMRLLGRDDDAVVDALSAEGTTSSRQPPGIQRQLLAWAIGAGLSQRAAEGPLTILVDDAHLADPVLLDGLEQATAAAGVPLWVAATAGPELVALRPNWGDRAAGSARYALEPLDLDAARAILLDLLAPAEFIPEPVVARLVELCEGSPLFLVEVAQLLRAEGRIRRLRGTESFYVDTDDLLRVSATPLAERLAERTLRSLPRQLVALARVAAILEEDVNATTVTAVAAEDSDLVDLDPGAGLTQLARAGLLAEAKAGYRFRTPLLCQAVQATIPAERRQELHEAAAAILEKREALDSPGLERLARHAAACGRRRQAVETYLELAERSLVEFDSVAAERFFTAARGLLGEEEYLLRQRALAGRGRARVRSRDLAGAGEDFREAQAISEARADTLALADLLLEEATLLDWAYDLAGAEALVQRAISVAGDTEDPRLASRFALALGRAHFRAERNEEAVEDLTRAVEQARSVGDYETEVVAELLLGPALVICKRFEDAERTFERAVALCKRSGDIVHLGAAYGNRVVLWEALQLYDRGLEDLRSSIECARVAGQPKIEMGAEHNLAELLLWMGRYEQAERSAARSHELVSRHLETPMLVVSFLPVRITCARGELGRARALLSRIDGNFSTQDVAPTERVLLKAVRMRCSGNNRLDDWEAVISEAIAEAYLTCSLEIAHLGISALLEAGDREGARRLLERAEQLEPPQLWQKRFAELAERLDQ